MAALQRSSILIFNLIVLQLIVQVCANFPSYGILSHRPNATTTESDKFCVLFYRQITTLPVDEDTTQFYPLADAMEWNACSQDEPPPVSIDDRLVFISMENNCSFIDKATRVQDLGGAGTLMVFKEFKFPNTNEEPNLTLAFMHNTTYLNITDGRDDAMVGLYQPEDSPMPLSLIAIWFLAMFSIVVGAYWSGEVRHKLYMEQHSVDGEPRDVAQEPVLPHEETSINMTVMSILGFVVMMCVMLLLLYFLYSYLVYIIIAMFCLASSIATFCCLHPIVSRIPCGTVRTPYFNLYIVHGTLMIREILLLIFAFGLSITWVILRKKPWAWILQDLLGVMFSINVLKLIRLPSLKICTFLLCGLVIYDIFFVFITPLLTSDGKSIMVEVAKGGASQEQMPMVLKVPVPQFQNELAQVCDIQDHYNLLGFGDILIPGLHIAFVHAFDLQAGTPCRLYFLINIIGYGSGLVTTFIALWLMNFAQPALLYLVPFTLIPTLITAAIRGDFMAMWRGDSEKFECEADDADFADDGQHPTTSPEPPASNSTNATTNHPHATLPNTD